MHMIIFDQGTGFLLYIVCRGTAKIYIRNIFFLVKVQNNNIIILGKGNQFWMKNVLDEITKLSCLLSNSNIIKSNSRPLKEDEYRV